ncbi:hypothetical protein ACTNDG_03165 [Clostridium sp. HCP1S3_B4]|uniref:hypothetical protein n=1 Tax=unclassified Clostridium TaxID=2614128 RepID=UPI003F89C847
MSKFTNNFSNTISQIATLLTSLENNNSEITEISDETNLLALNASIEAASTDSITNISNAIKNTLTKLNI